MARSALSVIDVYEQLLSAPDDKTRARIIATAFERLEDHYPELKDLATATGVRETELRLLKEIEHIRQETQQIRADMHKFEQQIRADIHKSDQQIRKEIEQIRSDMHTMEQKISKEIAQIRADAHQTELRLQKDIAEVHLKIETTSKKQVQWMVGLFSSFPRSCVTAINFSSKSLKAMFFSRSHAPAWECIIAGGSAPDPSR